MRHQPEHADADPAALPVIRGARWFDTDGRPFVLRIDIPLAFEELVAALYSAADPGDISSDEDLCGAVASTVLTPGLLTLTARAHAIERDEQPGAITAPHFLAQCRQRVATLLPSRPAS